MDSEFIPCTQMTPTLGITNPKDLKLNDFAKEMSSLKYFEKSARVSKVGNASGYKKLNRFSILT